VELTLETIALDHLALQELRTHRPALSAEEDRVSYWRSIVQARLDVLHTPGAGPADRLALQAGLTTDRVQRGPQNAPRVLEVYAPGRATGAASFNTAPPDWPR